MGLVGKADGLARPVNASVSGGIDLRFAVSLSTCSPPFRILIVAFLFHDSVALEVGGEKARDVWGHQWTKLMALIYEGVTKGIAGTDKRIGGTSSEGKAAQIRVQLEIERIMFGGR